MSRTNNVTFENVFAQNASTAIPSQPITGVSYRDDTQTAEQIETGQAYDSIYNSARYNQLFYQMTSLLADMAKNGLLPFQSGQHYLAGARVLDGGLIYIANREILASEQPYPSPNIDSQAWTPAVATSSDLGGDGASDQAVPSQKAVKTYVDDNFLPLDGTVENSIKWNGYSIGNLPETTFGTAGVGEGGEIVLAKGESGVQINIDNYYGNLRFIGYGNGTTQGVYTLNMDTGDFNVAASKLGTATVGSATKPIYLNGGTATACSEMNPAYVNVTEIGRYLDFHYDNGTKKFDYDCRICANTQGTAAGGGNLYFLAAQYYMSNKIVERIDSSSFDNNAGWIRFVSGLQICWGEVTVSAPTTVVTFAKAFSQVPCANATIKAEESGAYPCACSCTKTNCSIGDPSSRTVQYIVIGKWN